MSYKSIRTMPPTFWNLNGGGKSQVIRVIIIIIVI